MSLSKLVLVVFVFLTSAAYLKWFNVDAKLLGYVGMAYVVIAILEILLGFPAVARLTKRPATTE